MSWNWSRESHTMMDMREEHWRLMRAQLGLENHPIIGKGYFSTVFDNGNTVLKLTADEGAYSFLTNADRTSALPKVVNNSGHVGKTDGNNLFLLEIEKLEPLPRGGDARRLAARISNAAESYTVLSPKEYSDTPYHLRGVTSIKKVAKSIGNKPLLKAAQQIEGFLKWHSTARLDLHMRNMMVRPVTGELVIIDPIAGG